jgi:hypothetical protein
MINNDISAVCDFRSSVIDEIKGKVVNNATSYKITKDNIFIPFGNKRIKTKQQSYKIAKDKARELNKEYNAKKFGEVVSLDTSKTDGIGINIHPSENLLVHMELKQIEKQYNIDLNNDPERLLSETIRLQQEHGEFFNLNDKDIQRLERELPIESILTDILKFAVNIDNPNAPVTGIKTVDLKSYRGSRPNYNILGIANIAESTIYLDYANIDGITPIEEQMHFLTHILWDHPLFKNIRDNIQEFHQTTTWQHNYPIYLTQYDGNLEQTEKELVGKILAQYLYDKEAFSGITGKIKYALKKIIEFISSKIFGKNAQQKNAVRIEYNKRLKEVIDGTKNDPGFYKKLKSGEIKKIAETGALKYSSSNVSTANFDISKEQLLVTAELNKVKLAVRQLEAEKTGLTQLERDEFTEFYKDSKFDPVRNRVLNEKVSIRKAIVLELNRTDISEQDKNELRKLYKYFEADKIENEKTKLLKRSKERVEDLTKRIQEKTYIIGVGNFLFGVDKSNYADFIEDVDENGNLILKSTDKLDSSGILNDLDQLLSITNDINNGTRLIDIEAFETIRQTIGLYQPLLEQLDKIYYHLNKGKANINNSQSLVGIDGNKNTINHKIYRGVQLGLEQINQLDRFLKNNHNELMKNVMMLTLGVPQEIRDTYNNLSSDHMFTEIHMFYKYLGQYQHVKEDHLKILQREILLLDKDIAEKSNDYATNLFNNIKDDYKKHKNDMKLLFEKDSNGKNTSFLISDVKTSEYVANKEKFKETIIERLKQAASTYGINPLVIPNNYDQLYDFFKLVNVHINDPILLQKELKGRKELKDLYYDLWNTWNLENTDQLTQVAVDEIKKVKRDSLSSREYAIWWEKNHYIHQDQIIYKGELVKPKLSKYRNDNFNNIKNNSGLFKIYEEFRKSIYESKSRINRGIYSYEYFYMLPQISKTPTQIIKELDGKASLDAIREIGTVRIDDAFYGERFNGQLLRRPPIRYEKVIPPHLITQDLLSSVLTFQNMAENYVQKSRNMMRLQGMVDIINDSKVVDNKGTILVQGSSNLQKASQDLMNRFIYGEQMNQLTYGDYDFSKLSNNLYKWLVARNLLGNHIAILTGLFSGGIDTINDIIVGKYNSKKDYARGSKVFTVELPTIIRDYESPVKKSKVTLLASELELISESLDKFKNLNVNKVARLAIGTVNWGGWRAADMLLKGPSMVTTAIGIKKYKGDWYTKSQWRDANIKNKPDYDTLDTLWDTIDIKDNKIDWKDVPDDVKGLFKARVLNIASQLDTQPTAYDKGSTQINFIGRLFTMHSNWLWQSIARSFKDRSYNYMLQEYTQGDLRYTLSTLINPLKWLSIYRSFANIDDPLIKENITRVSVQIAAAYITFTIAYVMAAGALGDDDDDDAALQFSNYLAMRVYNEQAARLSIAEVINYISKPATLITDVGGILSLFDFIAEFLLLSDEENNEEVKSGIYKGYEQSTKNAIKNIPLIKGIFEGVGGGIINESLGKPSTSSGISYSKKADYIKTKVINDNTLFKASGAFPLGFYPKMLGGTTGNTIGSMLLENYNNDAILNMGLPTKKAN